MELFSAVVDGRQYVYLLDEIVEDFGVRDIDPSHTLVALLEPVNRVEALKLDGLLSEEELLQRMDLEPLDCGALAKLLNRHAPNIKRSD